MSLNMFEIFTKPRLEGFKGIQVTFGPGIPIATISGSSTTKMKTTTWKNLPKQIVEVFPNRTRKRISELFL